MLGTRDEAALAEVAKDPVTGNEAVPAEPSAAPGEPTEGWILAVDHQSVGGPGEPTVHDGNLAVDYQGETPCWPETTQRMPS